MFIQPQNYTEITLIFFYKKFEHYAPPNNPMSNHSYHIW
jgi:hypothetical protein